MCVAVGICVFVCIVCWGVVHVCKHVLCVYACLSVCLFVCLSVCPRVYVYAICVRADRYVCMSCVLFEAERKQLTNPSAAERIMANGAISCCPCCPACTNRCEGSPPRLAPGRNPSSPSAVGRYVQVRYAQVRYVHLGSQPILLIVVPAWAPATRSPVPSPSPRAEHELVAAAIHETLVLPKPGAVVGAALVAPPSAAVGWSAAPGAPADMLPKAGRCWER